MELVKIPVLLLVCFSSICTGVLDENTVPSFNQSTLALVLRDTDKFRLYMAPLIDLLQTNEGRLSEFTAREIANTAQLVRGCTGSSAKKTVAFLKEEEAKYTSAHGNFVFLMTDDLESRAWEAFSGEAISCMSRNSDIAKMATSSSVKTFFEAYEYLLPVIVLNSDGKHYTIWEMVTMLGFDPPGKISEEMLYFFKNPDSWEPHHIRALISQLPLVCGLLERVLKFAEESRHVEALELFFRIPAAVELFLGAEVDQIYADRHFNLEKDQDLDKCKEKLAGYTGPHRTLKIELCRIVWKYPVAVVDEPGDSR